MEFRWGVESGHTKCPSLSDGTGFTILLLRVSFASSPIVASHRPVRQGDCFRLSQTSGYGIYLIDAEKNSLRCCVMAESSTRMIYQVRQLANKAREHPDEPNKAVDDLRNAIW